MQAQGSPLEVKVWGEYACFTRPEMKVERVSYPVITPSAARGLLEAILWKPQFRWLVREVKVLKVPRYFSILRNEVQSKAPASIPRAPYYANDAGERQQRHTLALRDVTYIIRADLELTSSGAGEHPAKYRDQFRRRVETGACHHRPYLGCREFAASFAKPDGDETPVPWSEDLGLMLFDLDRDADGGRATPRFFQAQVDNGLLLVPAWLYDRQEVAHAAG